MEKHDKINFDETFLGNDIFPRDILIKTFTETIKEKDTEIEKLRYKVNHFMKFLEEDSRRSWLTSYDIEFKDSEEEIIKYFTMKNFSTLKNKVYFSYLDIGGGTMEVLFVNRDMLKVLGKKYIEDSIHSDDLARGMGEKHLFFESWKNLKE